MWVCFCKRWHIFLICSALFLKLNHFQGCLFRLGTYLSLNKLDLNCEFQLIQLHFSHMYLDLFELYIFVGR